MGVDIIPSKRPVTFCRIAGLERGTAQIQIPPMESEPRIKAERVPMLNSRCGIPLGDPPLAVYADGSLFSVHLGAELPLIKPVELCTRKGHRICRCGQCCQVCIFCVAKTRRGVTIWRHIARRPWFGNPPHVSPPNR